MVAIHTLGAGWRFCSGILYVLTWKFNGMMIHDVWLSQSDDFLHLYTYEPPTSHAAMSCSGIESGADQLSTHLQVRQILRSSLRVWVPAGTSGYQRVPLALDGADLEFGFSHWLRQYGWGKSVSFFWVPLCLAYPSECSSLPSGQEETGCFLQVKRWSRLQDPQDLPEVCSLPVVWLMFLSYLVHSQ